MFQVRSRSEDEHEFLPHNQIEKRSKCLGSVQSPGGGCAEVGAPRPGLGKHGEQLSLPPGSLPLQIPPELSQDRELLNSSAHRVFQLIPLVGVVSFAAVGAVAFSAYSLFSKSDVM